MGLAHTTAYNTHKQTNSSTNTNSHQQTPTHTSKQTSIHPTFITFYSSDGKPPNRDVATRLFFSTNTHSFACVCNVFSASSSGKNVLLERADYSPLTFRVLFVIFVYFFFLFSLPHTRARACMTVRKYLIKKRSAINTKKLVTVVF